MERQEGFYSSWFQITSLTTRYWLTFDILTLAIYSSLVQFLNSIYHLKISRRRAHSSGARVEEGPVDGVREADGGGVDRLLGLLPRARGPADVRHREHRHLAALHLPGGRWSREICM
jgi:hypothetical protein